MPEPEPGTDYILHGFALLNRSRPYDYGQPMPLRFSDIAAWVETIGVPDPDKRLFLIEVIQRIDAEVLADYHRQRDEQERVDARPQSRDQV